MNIQTVCISIVQPDDSIALMQFVVNQTTKSGDVLISREPTAEEIERELAQARIPFKSWRIVDPNHLPGSRAFRNAWRDDGKSFHHHMPTARKIFSDMIRERRAYHMAELDIRVSRALAKDDKKTVAKLEKARQALRDLTDHPSIANTQRVEEFPDLDRMIADALTEVA